MRSLIIFTALLLAGCQTTYEPQRMGLPSQTPKLSIADAGPFDGPVPDGGRLDSLVAKFDQTVFKVEGVGDINYVAKWTRPATIRIESNRVPVGLVVDAAHDMTSLTGLHLDVVSEGQGEIVIVTLNDMKSDDYCSAIAYANPANFVLQTAKIFVGPSWPESDMRECIAEELSQVMGPRNDTTIIDDSLWRPLESKTYHSLTWSDAVILRALYDQRLKPGMHKDKAMPIVRTIIGELLAELNQ